VLFSFSVRSNISELLKSLKDLSTSGICLSLLLCHQNTYNIQEFLFLKRTDYCIMFYICMRIEVSTTWETKA
jgi:hypothetical protein